jgi:hypothetical protein
VRPEPRRTKARRCHYPPVCANRKPNLDSVEISESKIMVQKHSRLGPCCYTPEYYGLEI